MRDDDVNAWMEDEEELFKADVYIRRKLDSIEQNAVPVRPVRDIHQEEDRARRAERRLKLREATLDVTVMPAALAPLAAAGCLVIPPVTLPAKVVVQEAGAGPSLSAHTLNHNPRLSVSASDVMDALGSSGTGASLAVYAMNPAAPAGLTAAVDSAVKAGDTLEVFMGLPDTVTFLDDVDSFKLSILDPVELWARKTTQALLKKHSSFLTIVGAQVIDPSSGPVKVALPSSSSSGGASSAAVGTRGKPGAQHRGGSASAAARGTSSTHIPAPPVVPLHDAAAAYRSYDASITADFQRRYAMGKEGMPRGDADTREALATNFAPRARWLTERAGNIAAGLVSDDFDVDTASAASSFHTTRRSSSALVELLRGKRDVRPWIKEAVSYPWLLWNRTEGYDDHIPVHIPLLRVITEHSYVDGYSIRAAWIASMNQAGGMPAVPPRQDLLLTAPKSARAAKASYGDMRSEFVYGSSAESERAVAGGSSASSSRGGAASLAGKKRSRLDFEPLLSELGEENEEEDEGDDDEEGSEGDEDDATSGSGSASADAPLRRRRRRQTHDADLYKRSYNPVGCTSRLRNIMAAAAASTSSSQEGQHSPGRAGRSRGRSRRDEVVQFPPIELPYEMPQDDRVMKVTLSYFDPHQGGGRASEAVCGADGRVSFGPADALIPLHTVGSLLYEAWARTQRGHNTATTSSTVTAGSASPSRSPGGGASAASRRILRLPVPGSTSKPASSSSGRDSEWALVTEDSSRYGASTTTPASGRGARGRVGSAAASSSDGGAGEGNGAGEGGDSSSSGARPSFLGRLLAVFSSRSGSASVEHTPSAASGSFSSPSRASSHQHAGSGSAGRSSASSGRH